MDPHKFTTLAHTQHAFLGPHLDDGLERLITVLTLPQGAEVVDIGCGKGELLLRLAQRYRVHGEGIDRNPAFIAEASQRTAARKLTGRLTWIQGDAAQIAFPHGTYDLVCCLGATGAFGGYRRTLECIRDYLAPDGRALIGEGFWRREPDQAYLDLLGTTRDEMGTHVDNAALARDLGYRVLYTAASTEAEWDHYEGLYLFGIESYAAAHPEDPDVPAMLERVRNWHDGYLRWGRDTLGYGVYLLQRS
ncbi:MAG TPA: class I SAM-dependent methyltransferase [bacterium]|nr:class I SAM-dependent methyltransferase [bacterium]